MRKQFFLALGHGTHSLPEIWKDYLAELLRESQR